MVRPMLSDRCPVCDASILWPNVWMDQDETWHGRRSRPRPLCQMGTKLPLPQKGHSPPIFGSCLLWPTGWMDQDATWYGGRLRPWPHCVRWGPSPLHQFSAYVCCGQTAGWNKMPVGIEVVFGAGHHVREGAQQPLSFRPVYCGQTVPISLLLLSICLRNASGLSAACPSVRHIDWWQIPVDLCWTLADFYGEQNFSTTDISHILSEREKIWQY